MKKIVLKLSKNNNTEITIKELIEKDAYKDSLLWLLENYPNKTSFKREELLDRSFDEKWVLNNFPVKSNKSIEEILLDDVFNYKEKIYAFIYDDRIYKIQEFHLSSEYFSVDITNTGNSFIEHDGFKNLIKWHIKTHKVYILEFLEWSLQELS